MPPVSETEALPVAAPKQVALVALVVNDKPPEVPITALPVVVQLWLSVTVSVYVPGATDEIDDVVALLLQR